MIRALLRRLLDRGDDGTNDAGSEDGTSDAGGAGGTTDAGGDGGTDEEGADDGDGIVWDLIPSRQYNGRYADSGGMTRGQQEKSLERIQQRADAIEAREEAADPELRDGS